MHDHPHTELEINIKPQISYPCVWSYRVIGLSEENVCNAVKCVFEGKADVSPIQHKSSHNKYVAINCSILVQTDEERLYYFESLVNQSGIVMVI